MLIFQEETLFTLKFRIIQNITAWYIYPVGETEHSKKGWQGSDYSNHVIIFIHPTQMGAGLFPSEVSLLIYQ